MKTNDFECWGYVQVLLPSEQQAINGGSGPTRWAGWLVGVTIGAYVEWVTATRELNEKSTAGKPFPPR
jgi:hypothetical protein